MKKTLSLFIMLMLAFTIRTTAMAVTSTAPYTIAPDSLHKKIKHPTVAMTDDQLNGILNKMRQKRNDAEKMALLKSGVKDQGITVDQLITLLNQFLTDDSKLISAEYAYPYTVNYKDFLKIQDYFAQEQTKGTLEDFVGKSK